jgi:hypothetical protein
VRGGVTSSTPARPRDELASAKPASAPQLVVGGGVTPHPGLRFGAGFAHGAYRERRTIASGGAMPAASATVFNLEGEYAIGYTRVAGEWIVDRFETNMTPSLSRGFNLQVTRTITPRWFAAGRRVRVSSPVLVGAAPQRLVASTAEATLGYRLTRTFTVRGGYQGSSTFRDSTWRHAAAVSVVWSQRWF